MDDKKDLERILIGLTGDVMIGRLVNERLNKVSPDNLWGDVLPLLRSTDINLINLEAALTNSKAKVPKVFNFKADPKHVCALKEGHIDVVNLANNHVLDYDAVGLNETIETLDRAYIKHVGGGKTLAEAREPVIFDHKGTRIGILGYTDNEPSWVATEDSPGTAYCSVHDVEIVKGDVQKLREQVDIVIVTLHWGLNMQERPGQSFINFAHTLVDSGVDIIHGHSAHIFQGVEVYHNKLILYDTGDFVDDYWVNPVLRNDRSFLFVVEIEGKEVKELFLHPTSISQYQVTRSYNQEADDTMNRMEMLSREFGTNFTRHPEGFLSLKIS